MSMCRWGIIFNIFYQFTVRSGVLDVICLYFQRGGRGFFSIEEGGGYKKSNKMYKNIL